MSTKEEILNYVTDSPNNTNRSVLDSLLTNYENDAYHFKGSVETEDELPEQGMKVGDVYNIIEESSYGGSGTNVAWDGINWDALGGLIDLSEKADKPFTVEFTNFDEHEQPGSTWRMVTSYDDLINAINANKPLQLRKITIDSNIILHSYNHVQLGLVPFELFTEILPRGHMESQEMVIDGANLNYFGFVIDYLGETVTGIKTGAIELTPITWSSVDEGKFLKINSSGVAVPENLPAYN